MQRRGTARDRQGVRAGDAALVPRPRRCWACCRWCAIPAVLAAINPRHAVRFFLVTTAGTASWCWARSSWWSPAARRSTPTWATSARGRSGSPGSLVVLPALLLNYFGQGALLLAQPGRVARTRSTSCWRPRLGALPAGGARHGRHRDRLAGGDLRAPSRSPARRCSSATCRGSRSCTPRRARSGRSTSRRSTGC